MLDSNEYGSHLRIAVINSVLANAGDAAIALGLIRAVKSVLGASVHITLFDSLAESTRSHYAEVSVEPSIHTYAWNAGGNGILSKIWRVSRWHLVHRQILRKAGRISRAHAIPRTADASPASRALGALAASDIVISTGGTYLVENYWLGPRFFEFMLVDRLGRSLILFTQSLGPFRKRSNRQAMGKMLRTAALVLVRDDQSRQHALDVAPEARVEVRADAAFALADPDVLRAARERILPRDRSLRVAISVREWSHFTSISAAVGMSRYRAAVAELVIHLVRGHGAEVVFISTCQGLPEYQYDDSRVAVSIVETLPDEVGEGIRVESAYLRPERIMAESAQSDVVVATRMHMGILSLCAGTPVLPIAYEFKTTELFGRLGMEQHVRDIESLTGDGLITAFEELLAALPAIRADLFDRVETERADAMAAGMRVREIIEEVR